MQMSTFHILPTAKIHEVATQLTSILNKQCLYHEAAFILKLSAMGVIGVCGGEYTYLKCAQL